jgi:hypothetical protein
MENLAVTIADLMNPRRQAGLHQVEGRTIGITMSRRKK